MSVAVVAPRPLRVGGRAPARLFDDIPEEAPFPPAPPSHAFEDETFAPLSEEEHAFLRGVAEGRGRAYSSPPRFVGDAGGRLLSILDAAGRTAWEASAGPRELASALAIAASIEAPAAVQRGSAGPGDEVEELALLLALHREVVYSGALRLDAAAEAFARAIGRGDVVGAAAQAVLRVGVDALAGLAVAAVPIARRTEGGRIELSLWTLFRDDPVPRPVAAVEPSGARWEADPRDPLVAELGGLFSEPWRGGAASRAVEASKREAARAVGATMLAAARLRSEHLGAAEDAIASLLFRFPGARAGVECAAAVARYAGAAATELLRAAR